MPHDRVPGSPRDWLRRAHSDLALALTPPSAGVLLEDLCFHAQQAVEKAFKAVLIAHTIPFPRTHNLTGLLELMPQDLSLLPVVREAVILTDYAVMSRYPGAMEPVEDEEFQEAKRLASAVVTWADMQVDVSPHS